MKLLLEGLDHKDFIVPFSDFLIGTIFLKGLKYPPFSESLSNIFFVIIFSISTIMKNKRPAASIQVNSLVCNGVVSNKMFINGV